MKVNTKQLQHAMEWPVRVARGVDQPVLRISSNGAELKLEARGCDQACEERIQCDGELAPVCVSASLFGTIAGVGGEFCELSLTETHLVFKSDGRKIHLPRASAEFVPLSPEGKACGIPSALLAEGVERTSAFMAAKGTRFELECVHIKTSATQLYCEAGNGKLFAAFSTAAICADLDLKIPGEFTRLAATALLREGAELRVGDRMISVIHAHGYCVFKQQEGRYLDTSRHMGAKRTELGKIDRDTWLEAFGCIVLLRKRNEDAAVVAVELESKSVSLDALGSADYSQVIEGDFVPHQLKLNALTFQECLNAFPEKSQVMLAYVDDFKAVALQEGDLLVLTTQMR